MISERVTTFDKLEVNQAFKFVGGVDVYVKTNENTMQTRFTEHEISLEKKGFLPTKGVIQQPWADKR